MNGWLGVTSDCYTWSMHFIVRWESDAHETPTFQNGFVVCTFSSGPMIVVGIKQLSTNTRVGATASIGIVKMGGGQNVRWNDLLYEIYFFFGGLVGFSSYFSGLWPPTGLLFGLYPLWEGTYPSSIFFFPLFPPSLFSTHCSSRKICSSAGALDAKEFGPYIPAILSPFFNVTITQ